MSWSGFKRSAPTLTDRVDGYSPTALSTADPWSTPDMRETMRNRALARADEREAWDGFRNELTSIGSWLKDKTFGGNQFGPDFDLKLIPNFIAESRWRGSDLGARVIETIPDEMTREGYDFAVQPTAEEGKRGDAVPPQPDDAAVEIVEMLEGKEEELGVPEAWNEALCYERAYGGAAVLIGADDGLPPDQPLDLARVKEVRHVTALSGGWDGECVSWSWNPDPMRPNFGRPDMYMVRNIGTPIVRIPSPTSGAQGARGPVLPEANPQQYGATYGAPLIYWVHASRLIVFPGRAASRRARVQMRGWGDSVFTRMDKVLADYELTWGAVANLLTDFSQGFLKVKGLLDMMGAAKAKSPTLGVVSRASALQLGRSIAKILLLDSEEEFGRDTASLAGIPELLQQFSLRLAAAADMPVDLLMGQTAAGGLNKGDTTVRFFYDRIRSRQSRFLMPQVKRLTRVIFLSKMGPTDGVEPERWSVTPRPLYQESPMERAQRVKTVAEADHIYITDQVQTPEETAAKRYGGSDFDDGPISIDFEARAEQAEKDEEDRQARAKAMVAAAGANGTNGSKPPPLIPPAMDK